MTLNELIQKTRRYTRDTTGALFPQEDVIDFCNEGINRMKQVILEFKDVNTLKSNNDSVNIIPAQYQHLIAMYGASRCFAQDEQQYQSSSYMNEFEAKLGELKSAIANNDITLVDGNGQTITSVGVGGIDAIVDVYFNVGNESDIDVG